MSDPEYDLSEYRSTALRAPTQPLVTLPETQSELTGPVYGEGRWIPLPRSSRVTQQRSSSASWTASPRRVQLETSLI
jgi:hypothetical protein